MSISAITSSGSGSRFVATVPGVLCLMLMGCGPTLRPLPAQPLSEEDRLQREARLGDASQRAGARRRLERLRFNGALRSDTVFAWSRFLRQHPQGVFSERAQERLALRRFAAAEKQGTLVGYRRFLRLHPQHPLAAKGWRKLLAVEGRALLHAGGRKAILLFLGRHPQSDLAIPLKKRLEAIDYQALGPQDSATALERFLRTHPSSPHGPAIRRRLEERLAERVAAFGDRRDLRLFLERFPGSRLTRALEERVATREVLDALASGELTALRAALARHWASAPAARQRALQGWTRTGAARLLALRGLVVAASPYRPRGRVGALRVAARLGDPPTASFALRALSYFSRLEVARVLVLAVASPDAGVALEATRGLTRWAAQALRAPARTLLVDLLAELRARPDGAARVGEIALLLALGDRAGLERALGARTWHRPWSVLPHVLWLELIPPGTPAAERVGTKALAVFQEELRRLGQMVPRTLAADNRRRAQGALFELVRLAKTLQGLAARHPRGTRWVERLRGLAEAADQRASELRRAVVGRFPDHRVLDPDALERAAKRHRAAQPGALERLRQRLVALRLPPEVRAALCGGALDLPRFCATK